MEIGFGRRHGDGSCTVGTIDSQIGDFDDISQPISICEPIWLRVSFFWILVTKLGDMIILQCVCKGRMGHAKVLHTKSS